MSHIRVITTALSLLLSLAGLAKAQSADTVIYYHTDAIGSVRMITDANGGVLARYDFQPFGVACGSACGTGSTPEAIQFAAKERDSDTQLDYFGARLFESVSGRFITVDPILDFKITLADPQSWNRYAYARNNPLRYVDPDGRQAQMLWVYVQQFLNSPQVQQAAQVAQTQGIRAWNGLTRLLNTPEGQELLEAGAQIAFNAQLPAARPKPPGVGAVIGHLEAGYATYGRTWGVKVFDFASEIWEGLSPGQRREWNQQFLDALIKDRVSVAVITNGYIKLGSTLKWEVEYLLEHGYTWSKTGDVLLPPIQ